MKTGFIPSSEDRWPKEMMMCKVLDAGDFDWRRHTDYGHRPGIFREPAEFSPVYIFLALFILILNEWMNEWMNLLLDFLTLGPTVLARE